MVDTDGRALVIQVRPADVQDRDGAVPLLKASRKSFPFVELAVADSSYAAQRVKDAASIAIEVVHRLADQIGFQVPPRRWVVERFLAWINRDRRLAKDFEAGIASAEAFPRRCHCHAAQSTLGALNLSFESDSKSTSP